MKNLNIKEIIKTIKQLEKENIKLKEENNNLRIFKARASAQNDILKIRLKELKLEKLEVENKVEFLKLRLSYDI